MSALNPFAVEQQRIYTLIYLHAAPSYGIQIWFVTGLLGIVLLLQLGTLFARWRKGDFWLFKTKKTVGGTFIVPHGVIGYTLIGAIFSIV